MPNVLPFSDAAVEAMDAGPVYQRIVGALRDGQPIAYTKKNHGFWERLIRIERLHGSLAISDDAIARPLDAQTGSPFFFESGFVPEVLELLKNGVSDLPDFVFCASIDAWPGSDLVEGTPIMGKARCREMMARMIPQEVAIGGDGLEFKRAAINGELPSFTDALRDRKVLLVGPAPLRHMGEFLGHPAFEHFEIHGLEARKSRLEILAALRGRLNAPGDHPVIIMQAGSLAFWLTAKLRREFERATLLDLGVVLNICNIASLANQNWSLVYGRHVAATLTSINESWPVLEQAFPNIADEGRRNELWLKLSQGRNAGFTALASKRGCQKTTAIDDATDTARPIAFIENKRPDHRRAQDLLSVSERENYYANGGPVHRMLEESLSRLLQAPADRKVVALGNGTVGLHVLAGLEAARRGKHLRWLGSAFTFFSAYIGPFANTQFVDCNSSGIIDRAALGAVDPETYDGVVYTNLFGAWPDVSDLADFCAEHGKSLLIDNATGLLDRPISGDLPCNEAVSCHHTKPWGFGEAGFIVVGAEDEALARQFLNFGNGAPDWLRPYGTNGKLSDIAAAYVYDRLERMPRWAKLYQSQMRRVMGLIERHELPLTALWDRPPGSPASSIPLLAPGHVGQEDLSNPHLVLRKYYRPADWHPHEAGSTDLYPVAHAIFSRIINMPIHHGLACLDDDTVVGILRQICDRAR